MEAVTLIWRKFTSFMEARDATGPNTCVYVQADPEGHPLRVGLAAGGLHRRYWGDTAFAMEAAMHGSGNLWFVATVTLGMCEAVQSTLIWQWRESLLYNQVESLTAPKLLVTIRHEGEMPVVPDVGWF